MSLLHIEAFSGLSGDMFLGALAELAGAHEEICALPALLGLQDEVEVSIRPVNKCGIACRQVWVREAGASPEHHHPHPHPDPHPHHHPEDHGHPHSHGDESAHSHGPHSGHHPHRHHHHRHLADIVRLIDASPLPDGAKAIAKEIFLLLGQAESEVHGIPLEQLHFHEVGAWDSITDIVGSALLLHRLQVTEAFCSPVTTGSGFTPTEHGLLPVPCPATKVLLRGMPTVTGEIPKEMTTPTGAAILRFLKPSFELPALIDEAVAYGPGQRDLPVPNVLRISLCRRAAPAVTLFQVQTNIDDMKGEYLGLPFQDGLLRAGARDFHLEQVIMKKGRPGLVLNALCAQPDLARVCDYILQQTSTIGLRYYPVSRVEAPRSSETVQAFGRSIEVKKTTLPSGRTRSKPASDAVHQVAQQLGIGPQEVESQLDRQINPDPQTGS